MKKYELTTNTIELDGITLYQIRALRDFGDVKAGDLGGYIQSEDNLSHYDNCWVSGNAQVYGQAWVSDDAQVFGNAWVYDNAQVYDNARVSDDAKVFGNAQVFGNACVSGNTQVHGGVWQSECRKGLFNGC